MFQIEDGRTYFWQWDINQRLIIDEAASFDEIHFSTMGMVDGYIKKPYQEDGKTYVEVPNQLLEKPWDISVYGWDKTHTEYKQKFEVWGRAKPQDYITKRELPPSCEEVSY